jgi:ion channel-forming bestrophin family protein
MHVGRSYRAYEFLNWSKRKMLCLLIVSTVPVLLYILTGFKGLALPWSVVLLLGTTVALVAGFKNTQTYNRSLEAQQIWSSISASSRVWGIFCHDFVGGEASHRLIYRHLVWLTLLRFELRSSRPWETTTQKENADFRKFYRVIEQEVSLRDELKRHGSSAEVDKVLRASNPAAVALAMQSAEIKSLLDSGAITMQAYSEMLKTLRDLHDQQTRTERIKNFHYPRQYAIVSRLFVIISCVLLPLGLIGQFDELKSAAGGFMKGYLVWLVVPLSVLIGSMYTSLDQVGDSTANPFEGGANDVPISQISRTIEIELKELLGEADIPRALEPVNGIAT